MKFRLVELTRVKGIAQIPLIVGLLLMAIAIPVATRLSQQEQDTRDMAAVAPSCSGVSAGSSCCTDCTAACCNNQMFACAGGTWTMVQSCSAGCKTDRSGCNASCAFRYVNCSSCGGGGCASNEKSCYVQLNDCSYKTQCYPFNSQCVAATNTPVPGVPTTPPVTSCGSHPNNSDWCSDSDTKAHCTNGTTYYQDCPYGCNTGSGQCNGAPPVATATPMCTPGTFQCRTGGKLWKCNGVGSAYEYYMDCVGGLCNSSGSYCADAVQTNTPIPTITPRNTATPSPIGGNLPTPALVKDPRVGAFLFEDNFFKFSFVKRVYAIESIGSIQINSVGTCNYYQYNKWFSWDCADVSRLTSENKSVSVVCTTDRARQGYIECGSDQNLYTCTMGRDSNGNSFTYWRVEDCIEGCGTYIDSDTNKEVTACVGNASTECESREINGVRGMCVGATESCGDDRYTSIFRNGCGYLLEKCCLPKQEGGGICNFGYQCISNDCVWDGITPPGMCRPVPFGGFCRTSNDCASGVCQNSRCTSFTFTPTPTMIPNDCDLNGGECIGLLEICDGSYFSGNMGCPFPQRCCKSSKEGGAKLSPTPTPTSGFTPVGCSAITVSAQCDNTSGCEWRDNRCQSKSSCGGENQTCCPPNPPEHYNNYCNSTYLTCGSGNKCVKISSVPSPTIPYNPIATPKPSTGPLPTAPQTTPVPTSTNAPPPGPTSPPGPPPVGCSYTSLQARVQENSTVDWQTQLTIQKGEKVNLGCMADGSGQLADNVKIVAGIGSETHDFSYNFVEQWEAPKAGNYTIWCVSTDSNCGNLPSNSNTTLSVGSACKECPNDFHCYGPVDDRAQELGYAWFATGYVMEGWVAQVPDNYCTDYGGLVKPQWLGKGMGDANCDGQINTYDFTLWNTEFEVSEGGEVSSDNWETDYTGPQGVCDGLVNTYDFSLWNRSYVQLEGGDN